MANLVQKSQLFLKRNSATILTCAGGVGVVATAALAVKATPKALQLIEQAKTEKGDELTKLEIVKVAAPVYIPSALTGVATLACIFGANALNKHQQAALISAYGLLDSSYKEYRGKMRELYGEDADERVKEEIVKDKKEDAPEVEDGKLLFFDEFSGRYFNSTLAEVQYAEYRLNRELRMRGYAYLNEFYEYLDIAPVDPGYVLGWSEGGNLAKYWQEWIDFTHRKTPLEDGENGLECHIITMLAEPYTDFMEYS